MAALDDIVITVSGTNYTYSVTEVKQGSSVVRKDLTNGTPATPLSFELSNTLGGNNKPDRRLVKFEMTKQDVTDPTIVATATAHVVFTVPRSSAISVADVKLLYEKLRTWLTSAKAEEIMNGKLL